MRIPVQSSSSSAESSSAFTLLEVMVAVGLFFMATFAILSLVSSTLKGARSLEAFDLDASSVVAELSLTNRLEEGEIPADIIQHFTELHPRSTCGGTIEEVRTNGLFKVTVLVGGVTPDGRKIQSSSEVLLFRQSVGPRGFGGRR